MTDWLEGLRSTIRQVQIEDGYVNPTMIDLLLNVVDASLIHKGHNDICSELLDDDDEEILPCDCGLSHRIRAVIALRAHVEDRPRLTWLDSRDVKGEQDND